MTVAAILMFGTDEAIRSWRGRHLIDYRMVSGDPTKEAQTDWIDRLAWEGNLLGAFEHIYRRLIDGLPNPFTVVNGVRLDQSDQHIAVREAFVNLLLHADYSEQEVSLIFRSPEGYFLRNPGSSRVPDLNPALGDRSDPRNPELVRMFRLIGLAEEAGSGVPRIVQAWRKLGFEAPSFDTGGGRYEFSVELRFTHLLSEDDRAWIAVLDWPLSPEEQLALVIARHEGWVDNGTLREMIGQHPTDVTRILGGLRDAGLLQMIGGGRGARYQLDPAVALLAEPDSVDSQSVQTSQHTTTPEEVSTADSALSSTGLGGSTPDSAQAVVDDPVWQQLTGIAEPVSSADYTPSAERNGVVLQLCAIRPLSLLELTWLMDRNKAYVRSILKSLINEGKLEYVYPDRPRHPGQRYRTVTRD